MIFEKHYSEITAKSSEELKAERKKNRYFEKRLKRLKRKRTQKIKRSKRKYFFCIGCTALFQRDYKGVEYVPQTHDKKFIFARPALCNNCVEQHEILRLSIKNLKRDEKGDELKIIESDKKNVNPVVNAELSYATFPNGREKSKNQIEFDLDENKFNFKVDHEKLEKRIKRNRKKRR